MFVVRRLTLSLVAALAVTLLYLAGRIVLPLVVAMTWSRFSSGGGGAAGSFIGEAELLIVLLVAFAGAWVWQGRSHRKG